MVLELGRTAKLYKVEDLSATGACLSGQIEAPPSSTFDLLLSLPAGSIERSSELVWTRYATDTARANLFGLHFKETASEANAEIAKGISSSDEAKREPLRILLADRHLRREDEVAGNLRELGHHILDARTPLDAIRILDRERVDVVVVGIHGPSSIDLEVASFVAEMYPTLPRIFLHDGKFAIPDTGLGLLEDLTVPEPWLMEDIKSALYKAGHALGHHCRAHCQSSSLSEWRATEDLRYNR